MKQEVAAAGEKLSNLEHSLTEKEKEIKQMTQSQAKLVESKENMMNTHQNTLKTLEMDYKKKLNDSAEQHRKELSQKDASILKLKQQIESHEKTIECQKTQMHQIKSDKS